MEQPEAPIDIETSLELAKKSVQKDGMSMRKAATLHGLSFSKLRRRLTGETSSTHKLQLLPSKAEHEIVKHMVQLESVGLPIGIDDLRVIARDYLQSKWPGKVIKLPSETWARKFLGRHKGAVKLKRAQDIKNARAKVSKADLKEYHDSLMETLKDIPLENILNYNESAFVDCICRPEEESPNWSGDIEVASSGELNDSESIVCEPDPIDISDIDT